MSTARSTTFRGDARRLLMTIGGIGAGLILAFSIVGSGNFDSGSMGAGQDARSYWLAVRTMVPYEQQWGTYGAYVYSPAFSQLLGPLFALPWQQFLALWTFLLMAGLLVLTGPLLFALALPLAFPELWGGNIHLLLALAIVAGFRWPAAWSFVLLTKVTPGIGLIWFAVRREWRSLGLAAGATAAIAGGSWLVAPGLWHEWFAVLLRNSELGPLPGSVGVSLWLRLPIAVLAVAYGARTNRRWLVPIGAMLAMPALWGGAATLMFAALAVERARVEEWLLGGIERLDASRRASGGRPRWIPATRG
jgi:hypothetical protein